MRNRSLIAVLISCSLAGGLQLLAARPGWMSEDSIDMWEEATGAQPFTDLHTPLLSWLWSFLSPWTLGPLLPVTIALVVFWVAVTSICVQLSRVTSWVGVFVPWGLLAIPQTWVLGYAWKDAALMACLAVSVALFSLLAHPEKEKRVPLAVLLSVGTGLALAGAALTRVYLLPSVILLAFGMLAVFLPRTGRGPRLNLFGALAMGMAVGVAIQALVVKPLPSFNGTSALMFDLARLQCRGVENVAVPDELVIQGTSTYCDRIDPGRISGLFFPTDPLAQKLRWPQAQDDIPVRTAWVQAATDHPLELATIRVDYLLRSLLVTPERYVFVVTDPGSFLSSAEPGSIGIGEKVGFPSGGGPIMLIAAIPLSLATATSLTSLMSPFWLVGMLPFVALLRLRRNDRGQWKRWILLLASPAIFAMNLAAIALHASTRITAPFVLLGVLLSLVTLLHPPDSWGRKQA